MGVIAAIGMAGTVSHKIARLIVITFVIVFMSRQVLPHIPHFELILNSGQTSRTGADASVTCPPQNAAVPS